MITTADIQKEVKPPKYPEHEKLKLVKDQSQAIGEFIEWLKHEKGIHLAMWYEDKNVGEYLDYAIYRVGSIQKLLGEYFEIDQDKLESEKRQILDEWRSSQGTI